MNKLLRHFSIISVLLAGLAVFLPVNSAWAGDNLIDVEFENRPLFNEANFMPGDAVARWAVINNVSGSALQAGVMAANVREENPEDENDLSEAIKFEIKKDGEGTPAWTGTLKGFFGAGEIGLANIPAGSSAKYFFSATFEPESGNDYQGKTVVFDIAIGVLGEAETYIPSTPTVRGGGGGGRTELIIFNEQSNGVTENQAVITWNTNLSATSRVIYGKNPEDLDLGLPYGYGYPSYTDEFDTPYTLDGVISHQIVLGGLDPATTYYFRVVSRLGWDPSISPEFNFTTLGKRPIQEGAEQIIEGGGEGSRPNPASGTSNRPEGGETQTGEEEGASGEETGEDEGITIGPNAEDLLANQSSEKTGNFLTDLLASIGLLGLWNNPCVRLMLLFLAIAILYILLRNRIWRRQNQPEGESDKGWDLPVLAGIFAIFSLFLKCYLILVPSLLLILYWLVRNYGKIFQKQPE